MHGCQGRGVYTLVCFCSCTVHCVRAQQCESLGGVLTILGVSEFYHHQALRSGTAQRLHGCERAPAAHWAVTCIQIEAENQPRGEYQDLPAPFCE